LDTKTICAHNTCKGFDRGVFANGTNEHILFNYLQARDEAIKYKGNSGQTGGFIDGNICDGAYIQIGEWGSGQGQQPNELIIGRNNVFLNVTGSHIRFDDDGSGSVALGARAPVSFLRDIDTDANWSLGTTIQALYTDGGAVALNAPSTNRVREGQELIVMQGNGDNTITVDTFDRTFADNVDTVNNTITLISIYDEWQTGGPVRIDAQGNVLPDPLVEGDIYFLIVVNAASGIIALATTEANALADTRISLTTTGDSSSKKIGDLLYDNSGSKQSTIVLTNRSDMLKFISLPGAWRQVA
jgi:hypothetical protein